MSAPEPIHWSSEDQAIETEFAEVIELVRENVPAKPVPRALDRRVKEIARGSAFDEIEQSWLLGNGAKLVLGTLVFFAIAMLWLML